MKRSINIYHNKILLRLATKNDVEFLSRLHYDDRVGEFRYLNWTDEAVQELLRIQFSAQDQQYRRAFPNADLYIIEYEHLAIGRLQVDRSGDQIRLIDICLAQPYRQKGIGTNILQDLIAESIADNKKISLQVLKTNPAYKIYQRLGFQLAWESELYSFLIYGGKNLREELKDSDLEIVNT